MKHLIDTQSLIWYVDQNQWLGASAAAAMTDSSNELLISPVSL